MARVLVQDTSSGEFFWGGGKWGADIVKGFNFEDRIWAEHFIALQQQGKRRSLAVFFSPHGAIPSDSSAPLRFRAST